MVANVTVVEPTQAGVATRSSRPAPQPDSRRSSTSPRGRNVPNLAIVGLGADGTMTVKLASGPSRATRTSSSTCSGWISTSRRTRSRCSLFTTGPGSSVDTRKTGGPFRAGQVRPVQIRGADIVHRRRSTPAVPNGPAVDGRRCVNIAAVTNRLERRHLSPRRPTPPGTESTTVNVNVSTGQIKTSHGDRAGRVGRQDLPVQPSGDRSTWSSTCSATSRQCRTTRRRAASSRSRRRSGRSTPARRVRQPPSGHGQRRGVELHGLHRLGAGRRVRPR